MQLREVAGSAATLTVGEWGEARRPPFLCWHSIGRDGSGAMFDMAARWRAEAGYHVLVVEWLQRQGIT